MEGGALEGGTKGALERWRAAALEGGEGEAKGKGKGSLSASKLYLQRLQQAQRRLESGALEGGVGGRSVGGRRRWRAAAAEGEGMARRARECARGSAHLQQGHQRLKKTLLLASVGQSVGGRSVGGRSVGGQRVGGRRRRRERGWRERGT